MSRRTKKVLRLIDLIKKFQDSAMKRNPSERQPVRGLQKEQGQRKPAGPPPVRNPKGRHKRRIPRPSVPEEPKIHGRRRAAGAGAPFKEEPRKGGKWKGVEPPVMPKKWKNLLKERDRLVIALLVQMEGLYAVTKNVSLINHLDSHVSELEAAKRHNMKLVIEKVKRCRCQVLESKKRKDEMSVPRIGRSKLTKLLAEKRLLMDELFVQVEDLDPTEGNLSMIYHLDGHLLDLQLAGVGAMGAVVAETKNCRCQAIKRGKMKEQREDLIYELMVQIERKHPTSANLEAIDHLESHIWDLDIASADELRVVMRNIKNCACQAALPKDFNKVRERKGCFRQRGWRNALMERNNLMEKLSAQLKAFGDSYRESHYSLIKHLQRHLWLLQRAKEGDIPFLTEKAHKCWCQTLGQCETYEPAMTRQGTERTVEDSSPIGFAYRPDDRAVSWEKTGESSPQELSPERQQRGEFQGREIPRRRDIFTSINEAEPFLANIVGQQLLQQIQEERNALNEKMKEFDEGRELLNNERRALYAERERFNQEKREELRRQRENLIKNEEKFVKELMDLKLDREAFQKEKETFYLDYADKKAELMREKENLTKKQERPSKEAMDLKLDREALHKEKQTFYLDYIDKKEELIREEENLTYNLKRVAKEAMNLKLDKEALEKEKRLFYIKVDEMRGELREEKEELITEQEMLRMDIAAFNQEKEKFYRMQDQKEKKDERKIDLRLKEKSQDTCSRSVGIETKRQGPNSMQLLSEELKRFMERFNKEVDTSRKCTAEKLIDSIMTKEADNIHKVLKRIQSLKAKKK
ncbi:trichohyalin-like [Macrobrachium nipponense]|uniref:trichohyalin-like n=1 Tax=Macrobrachium nipponense TaxID=159736 RepID=UPI0030C7E0CA